MIAIDCRFQSVVLRTQVNVKVYLPHQEDFLHPIYDYREHYTFAPFKTMFLLHGLMDSADQWIENTSITRIAQEAGIALVIPSCGNNFYVNTVYGANWYDFFIRELTGFVYGIFPLSDKRADNYIWGISMGGYGALRIAFNNPEMFSKVIVMSPTTDIEFTARFSYAMGVNTDFVLGDWKNLKGSELDISTVIKKAAATSSELPDVLAIIADQDHMVRDNTEFKEIMDDLGINNDFRICPGDHTWGFWDRHVQECVEWLK